MFRYLLYSTVTLTGGAVLIIEVAATRFLSPYFGASLYVLSSVLSCILGALALGYFVGGRLADRYPSPRLLYTLLGGSGLLTILLFILSKAFLLDSLLGAGIWLGPLLATLTTFFIPALILGIDSPFVVRLVSEELESTDQSGRIAGTVFCLSTIGSIIGSVLAGFYIIPTFGVSYTIIGTASVIVIGAVVTLWSLREIRWAGLLLISFLFTLLITHHLLPGQTQLVEASGLYSELTVSNGTMFDRHVRLLRRDLNYSSVQFQDNLTTPFDYMQYAELYPRLQPETNDYLILGGGAYTIPKQLIDRNERLDVTVVEIEPSLYSIAQEHFHLEGSEQLTVHTNDARVFLQETKSQYDIILIDVMNSGHVLPSHLTSQEFFILVKSRLRPDGVVIFNTVSSPEYSTPSVAGSLYKTVQSVFPNTIAATLTAPEAAHLKNVVYLAKLTDQEFVLPDVPIRRFNGTFVSAADTVLPENTFDRKNEYLLTDDQPISETLIMRDILAHTQLHTQ